MKITRTRMFRVNMGNWGEKYEFGSSVTVSHNDLGYSDEEWAEDANDEGTREELVETLKEFAEEILAEQIREELEDARDNKSSDSDSFIDSGNKKRRK